VVANEEVEGENLWGKRRVNTLLIRDLGGRFSVCKQYEKSKKVVRVGEVKL